MSDTKKMLDPDPRVWDFETEYELGQDNIRPFGLDIHNPVFVISSVVIAGFVSDFACQSGSGGILFRPDETMADQHF